MLFRSIIDMDHELAKLARAIDWRFLEEKFGAVYTDRPGRPPLPTRLMVGLAILNSTRPPFNSIVVPERIDSSDIAICSDRGAWRMRRSDMFDAAGRAYTTSRSE